MQDRPDGAAILRALESELRAGLAPGFAQKVGANAIALALREAELTASSDEAERSRLAQLLGRDGSLKSLNRALAQAIRDGTLDCEDDQLIAHLIRTTIEKLNVDQPTYPAFVAWHRSTAGGVPKGTTA